jgi:membrane fusion protein, multidrug efflux system
MIATQPIENMTSTMPPNHPKTGRNRQILLGTFIILVALFTVGFVPRWHANATLTNALADQRPIVTVVRSQAPSSGANLVLPGSTQAIQETAIYARTNGYVRKWNVDIGATVEAGQLLAEIDTPEIDQELNQARASVTQAKANANLAQATLARWQQMVAQKVVSSQEFDEKQSTAEARAADLEVAQANVKRLEELQSFEKVMAPFSGIVTARNIDNGNLVTAGNTSQTAPLFRIAQTSTLRIYVTVPQTQTRSIAPGQTAPVSVREVPDRIFNAKVVRTAGALDPASRTLLTELQLPNDDGQLFPGMYAEVKFNLAQDDRTLLVPGSAVMIQSDGPKVLLVDAKQTIRLRPIKLGRDLGEKIEVISGLESADAVVANPTDSLRDGTEVKVQSETTQTRK